MKIAGYEFKNIEKRDEESQNDIAEISKRGYQLLKENIIDSAIGCFEKILASESTNHYALVGMGDSYRKKGEFESAIEYYQKCLKYFPTNNYALFGLADCYKALKQYGNTIEIWERYHLHDNKNVTVLTRIADAYRKVKNFDRSLEVYHRVLEIEEDNSYAITGLGHLYYDFRRYEDALFYWEKLLALQGVNTDIRILTSIGNCYRKLREFENGIPFFERALLKQSDNFYALFGLADCLWETGHHGDAIENWKRILDKNPSSKFILTRMGDASKYLGNFDKAEEYYQTALNIEFDLHAIIGLGSINRLKGNYDEAVRTLSDLLHNHSYNPRIYMELAHCYEDMKKYDSAIEVLSQYMQTGQQRNDIQDYYSELKARCN